ncbi:MAG: hypothetical protein RMM31_03955 [Anaerolineae bacterium]|nr:hypothetical protein [Anaerolineae bacterium]
MNLTPDLVFAEVVAAQLDDYLHAEVLFYPVGSVQGVNLPPLTIGAWLETAWRLKALRDCAPAQVDAALDRAQAEVQKLRRRIPELYQAKARREFKSRLDTWEMFLDERSEVKPARPYNELAGYATHAHTRLKLELLKEDESQLMTQLARLRLCDARLRARFKPGGFIWERELQPAAPPERFWWLYAASAESTAR